MYCKSCGNKIDADSVFCSFCGIKQSVVNKPRTQISQSTEKNQNNTIDERSQHQELSRLINNQVVDRQVYTKYDNTYEKEYDAIIFGIFILLFSIIFTVAKPFSFESQESFDQYKVFISISALLIRIFSTVWVSNIAKRQNRDTTIWGVLAFLFPSIVLIIIGSLRKLNTPIIEDNKFEEAPLSSLNIDINSIQLSKLPEARLTIKDVIQNKDELLINYLKGYPDSISYKNLPNITPLYIYQELTKRGILIDDEMLVSLEKFAKDEGYYTFESMLLKYR